MDPRDIAEQYPIQMDQVEPGYRISELQVMKSGAGYYLGRAGYSPEGYPEPYSRETGYFATREEAQTALDQGCKARVCPENDLGYEDGTLPRPTGINFD